MEEIKKNDIIKVTIIGVQKYGAFVTTIDGNYNGLIHISEISYGFVKNVKQMYYPKRRLTYIIYQKYL